MANMMKDVLTQFHRNPEIRSDWGETISNICIGFLRIGFGKTYKVEIDSIAAGGIGLTQGRYPVFPTRIAAVALVILAGYCWPLTLGATVIGFVATKLSCTHRYKLEMLKPNLPKPALDPEIFSQDARTQITSKGRGVWQVLYANSLTVKGLEEVLRRGGIDINAWASDPKAKTPAQLLKELTNGESYLLINQSGQLIRFTPIVTVKCLATTSKGERLKLFEEKQVMKKNSAVKKREQSPGVPYDYVTEKSKPNEPVQTAALRGLSEELQLSREKITNLQSKGNEVKEIASTSYPGLRCIYDRNMFTCEIPFKDEGYQEKQPDKTTYFRWMPIGIEDIDL